VLPFEEHWAGIVDTDVTTGTTASHRLGMDYRVLGTTDLARYWFHAPTYELGSQLTPDLVVFSRRTDAPERIDDVFLSCPCPDVQRTIQASCPHLRAIANDTLDTNGLPWGFVPFDAPGIRQRLTPGLPSPATLRLQAFSTS